MIIIGLVVLFNMFCCVLLCSVYFVLKSDSACWICLCSESKSKRGHCSEPVSIQDSKDGLNNPFRVLFFIIQIFSFIAVFFIDMIEVLQLKIKQNRIILTAL